MGTDLGLHSDPGGKLNFRFSQKPFLSSFLIVLALMALSMSCFTPYFFANDDVFALMIVKGVGLSLKPDEHLYFQNVLLGLLLKKLYILLPQVRWYPWFEVGTLFLALWAFLAGLFLKSPNWPRAGLFGLYFLFVGLFYLTQMDYTMLSCLAGQAGVFLWMAGRDEGKAVPWGKALALGGLCFLGSFIFRFQAFCFSVLTALPFIASVYGKGRIRRREVLAALAVALAALLGILFDHYYYQGNPGWKDYARLNPVLNRCLEYQHWDYNPQTEPVFKTAGWDSTDFRLFFRDYYLDGDIYSPDRLQGISAHFDSLKSPSWGFLPGLISASTSLPLYELQNIMLCLATFLLLCPPPGLKLVLWNALWVLLGLLALASYAKAPERLFLPALTFLAALALYHAEPPLRASSRGKKKPMTLLVKTGMGLTALLLALTLPLVARYASVDSHFKDREKLLSAVVQALHPQDNQLFVIWNSRFPYEKISAFDSFEEFRTFHILSLASFQRTPLAQAVLDHFGVKNPLREMVENPRLFMVGSEEEGELSRQYLKEKFGLETRLEEVFFSPFFNVDRIRLLRPERNKK